MKAYTKYTYGGPEILKLEEVEKPGVKPGHLLVKVMANSANPADWHILRGKPFLARLSFGLFKPKNKLFGADFAGIVEDVGDGDSKFKKGDRVFGEMIGGAFAEYVCASEKACAKMPENASFTEMAGVPIAGLTALQALTTHGNIKAGESVLINGSSGGVGHFTVQIAKAMGARVTGVCSSKNEEFVSSLGAENIISYDKENMHKHTGNYDLIIDTHGNLNHSDFTRMGKRGVVVGFTTMEHMMLVIFKNTLSKFQLKQFTAQAIAEDLEKLSSLVMEGKVKTHISKIYPYTEIPEAINFIEAMHTRGKVAISWQV